MDDNQTPEGSDPGFEATDPATAEQELRGTPEVEAGAESGRGDVFREMHDEVDELTHTPGSSWGPDNDERLRQIQAELAKLLEKVRGNR